MIFRFRGEVFHWRGPSPYYFVAVPEDESERIHDVASLVTYGWGVIPVGVRIGRTEWATSLFPRDGGYAVPIKEKIRRAEQIGLGDQVTVTLTITMP